MKKIVLATLFLALVAGLAWAEQPRKNPSPRTLAATPSPKQAMSSHLPTSSLQPLTEEKAFYYFIAIYGTPDNVIERYGNYFDVVNYKRAMADEFERGRYTEGIRARIADGVRKLNFTDKFTLDSKAYLGQYSFPSHSFPLSNSPYTSFCRNMDRSYGICGGTLMDVRIDQNAVNGKELNWSVPMSEAEASAFVKSRNIGGSVNRDVATRIIYSITNKKGKVDYAGRGGTFSPYIYSVEVFSDDSLTKKLAVITPQPGTPISAFMPEAALVAQSATKVIATYHYTASCREDYKCVTPIVGTITLTDVGITLSGEQRNGSAKPSTISFFSAFAGGATNLWRANFTNGTWGGSDFRVVWQPFWEKDYNSKLVFADRQERDRFFVDLTVALQEWAAKYSQFAFSKLNIYQRCEGGGGHFVTCSESSPFEVNPQKTETGDSAGSPPPAAKPAGSTPMIANLEIEQKQAEQRQNIANAQKTLIGTWRDENSLITYKPDGTRTIKADNGNVIFSRWHVDGDLIIRKDEWIRFPNGKQDALDRSFRIRILYIDKDRYTIKDDGGTWNAKRIN